MRVKSLPSLICFTSMPYWNYKWSVSLTIAQHRSSGPNSDLFSNKRNCKLSDAMLIPRSSITTGKLNESFYELLLKARPNGIDRVELGIPLDQELQSNIHCNYASEMSQLGPVRVDL